MLRRSNHARRTWCRYFFFILLSVFLLPAPACQTKTPRNPGFLYLRLNADPTTLDPALIVDVTGASIAAKLFNGLIRFDRQLRIHPDIAERWTISDDGIVYTFHLRPGVRFSNGRDLTAEDVKYSFERVLHPQTRSPRTWVLDRIKGAPAFMKGKAESVSGIRVRDDHTVEIHLEESFGPFLSLLSLTTAYIVPREEVERWGSDFSFHVIGSGPFRLTEWRHGQQIHLALNPLYTVAAPHLQGIVYSIIPEDLTAMVEFEMGNIDIIQIPSAEFRRYKNHSRWNQYIIEQPGLNIYYLGLNCQRHPLDDSRIRKAVSLAIDRDKMLRTVFESRGQLAGSPIPPILRNRMPPPQKKDSYNPAKARILLEEAGYPNGLSLRITIPALSESLDIVEVIQHYLQQVGIRTSIMQLEWSSFKESLAKGETDAFWLSWWADYPDVENFLYPLFHSRNHGAGGNRTFYENSEVDRLIEQAQRSTDEVRLILYYQAESIILQETPMVLFWNRTDHYLRQPWVNNFVPSPLSTNDQGTEVSIGVPTS